MPWRVVCEVGGCGDVGGCWGVVGCVRRMGDGGWGVEFLAQRCSGGLSVV